VKFPPLNRRRTALALAFMFLVEISTQAKHRLYQTGKLVYLSATPTYVSLPDFQGGTLTVPFEKIYGFTVESEGSAYMGMCIAKSRKYRPEWTIAETIEYRLERNRIFLKHHNGKEQALVLESQGRDQRSMTQTNPGKKQEVPECTK
jgi:hypothetical protein